MSIVLRAAAISQGRRRAALLCLHHAPRGDHLVDLLHVTYGLLEGHHETDSLQQLQQLVDAETSMPDDGAQGSSVQLPVVRDHHLREGVISSEDDVASRLTSDIEPRFLQRLDAPST